MLWSWLISVLLFSRKSMQRIQTLPITLLKMCQLWTQTSLKSMINSFQIALACIHMACVIHNKDCKNWFAELRVDLEKVQEISKYILQLYELWKNFDEKKDMSGILQKMPKPKLNPPSMQQTNWKKWESIEFLDLWTQQKVTVVSSKVFYSFCHFFKKFLLKEQ